MAAPLEQTGRSMTVTHRPRRWLRFVWLGLLALVALAAAGVGTLYAIAAGSAPPLAVSPVLAQTTSFDGRYLLAASDADMVGTAYADGRLMQIPGDQDTLSLIPLPLTDATAQVIDVPVSNSVTSWPQIIAVAPDGNTVYVVETARPIDDEVEQLATQAMPPGRLVTVIDLAGGANAARTRTIDVGEGANHLAISADGAFLAVGLREAGRQLAILPTASLDNPATFHYFDVERADGTQAEEVTSVFWHPSGQFLGVGIDASEIQFFRVKVGASGVEIAPHGERITGGNRLTYGQFTADGRFYLTSELNWARYPGALGHLLNPPSELVSIRFDTTDAAQHVEVARVPVGLSAEGFAVSPQGDLVVTVDMSRTYLPDWLAFWPGTQLNSLTLLSFDRETGVLSVLGEPYGFEGVLPEDAMFDADGDSLGVVIYNERERPMAPGVVEFWNVVRGGDATRLERTAVRLEVVRGPHAMNLVR